MLLRFDLSSLGQTSCHLSAQCGLSGCSPLSMPAYMQFSCHLVRRITENHTYWLFFDTSAFAKFRPGRYASGFGSISTPLDIHSLSRCAWMLCKLKAFSRLYVGFEWSTLVVYCARNLDKTDGSYASSYQ